MPGKFQVEQPPIAAGNNPVKPLVLSPEAVNAARLALYEWFHSLPPAEQKRIQGADVQPVTRKKKS